MSACKYLPIIENTFLSKCKAEEVEDDIRGCKGILAKAIIKLTQLREYTFVICSSDTATVVKCSSKAYGGMDKEGTRQCRTRITTSRKSVDNEKTSVCKRDRIV